MGLLAVSVLVVVTSRLDIVAARTAVSVEGGCHDAVLGEMCYDDTIWAKQYAINTRAEWYPGLTSNSSFADFQAHLHHCYWNRCPPPCAATTQKNCSMTGRFWDGSKCQDAKRGSQCFMQVTWAMTHGIRIYPQWYPTMTKDSTFREFQRRLFEGQQSGLEFNDCPEPCCHDSVPGELCFEDTEWARLYGINLEAFNHVYPPSLSNESAFEEFQAYLHLCYPERCPEPCVPTELLLEYQAGKLSLDCPDDKRTP